MGDDPMSDEMMRRAAEIKADLAAVNKIRRNLAETQRTVIRWLWEEHGWTHREAAAVFGIPKSTLQRWATLGEWNVT